MKHGCSCQHHRPVFKHKQRCSCLCDEIGALPPSNICFGTLENNIGAACSLLRNPDGKLSIRPECTEPNARCILKVQNLSRIRCFPRAPWPAYDSLALGKLRLIWKPTDERGILGPTSETEASVQRYEIRTVQANCLSRLKLLRASAKAVFEMVGGSIFVADWRARKRSLVCRLFLLIACRRDTRLSQSPTYTATDASASCNLHAQPASTSGSTQLLLYLLAVQ